ncbi:class I SAM-dependent DNA methyltransferase [Sedimentitalea todarodis]|uniref:Class I SAM-dependent methyltransferase n=1 Tax=Sedimentitalea todarodis TaxID=1631240 RepID=A0ABU3VAK6_9RHOB|nr:class I SAM-dependent methyltransferase [Sedimentitalea todarodis]MDU9002804.1 class I SAM-dependent methyltransferase [Sedimentitalea todarodis]
MSERETLNVYDDQAETYQKIMADWDDPAFADFLAEMPRGGAVLDLGCGPGHAAARMADTGLHVIATDGSLEMIRLAAQHPGVSARQATFDEIDGQSIYDGIWASFSLLHAPRAKFPLHLAALHRAAKPGARLHLAMKLGRGEATDRLGRFYSYYSRDELEQYLQEAGFTVASHRTGREKGLAGTLDEWIAIAAHA